MRSRFSALMLGTHLTAVEFDSPSALLKKGGLFRSLVDESTDKEKLIAMAHGEHSSQ